MNTTNLTNDDMSVTTVVTSNDSLSGLATRDGVTLVAGNLVLAVGQSDATTNGVYIAASGAWTRVISLRGGQLFKVLMGTVGAGINYELRTSSFHISPTGVCNTSLTFSPITGSGGGSLLIKGSATTDASLVAGNVVCVKTNGNLTKPDGTETLAQAIIGIADGTYSSSSTANYFKPGQLATGLSGLTVGTEYWAKQDGTLAIYSAVGSGDYTCSMGVARSTTSLEVNIGPVVQHA